MITFSPKVSALMKGFISLSLLLCTAHASVGQLVQTPRVTPQGTGYLEYLPPDYATNTSRTYPLLIFLHGSGEMGTGSAADLEKLKVGGPPKEIKNGSTMCFNVNGVQECFIVISPQLNYGPGGWWSSILTPFFNEILNGTKNYRIDKNRVYLTGLSMGGQGVYIGLGQTSDIFAAGAVVAGFDNTSGCTIAARKIPVWGFHGTSDTTIPYDIGVNNFNAIINCTNPVPSAELKWTSYPGVGHNAWDKAYTTDHSVQTPLNVYEWLLTKRKNGKANVTPTVNAGADQVLQLPANSNTLIGSASDTDGTISSYAWTEVSGPAATLKNANTASLSLSSLVTGSYVFRLTATDNSGGVGSDDVNVTVTAAAPAPTPSPSSNIALQKSVTTSSNQTWLGAQGIGSNAVDGNLTTRWSSAFTSSEWISVDLGSNYSISKIKIFWESSYAVSYKVEYSQDGVGWTTIKTVTGNTSVNNELTDIGGTTRFVKITGLVRAAGWGGLQYGYSIYELEVYGTSGSTARTASAELIQVNETESVQASEADESMSFTFLDKKYTGGKQYDVVVFNASGNKIYSGQWSDEVYREMIRPNEFYFYQIFRDGKRIDSGKMVTTNQ